MTTLDLAGLGLGPFNLSLAALAEEAPGLRARFFERRPRFAWHPGLMLPDAMMQTSFLKDMVTPLRPTSRWSFLSYLVEKGRFYDFLSGRFATASRAEFADYMGWVAHGLPTTRFGRAVESVTHDGARFQLRLSDGETACARAICVGSGPAPHLPDFAPDHPDCLHASDWLLRKPRIEGRRVVVIGGGQSGAELALHLLRADPGPTSLVWISRRSAVWTLQEGVFIDQFFTPGFAQSWRALPQQIRAPLLEEQKYASDGVTPQTAEAIYDALYRRVHLEGRRDIALRPGREAISIAPAGRGFEIAARAMDGVIETVGADVVALATGYRPHVPACLAPLAARLERVEGGALALDAAYRARWDGPRETPIYAMNHGRMSHGIVDPQLSLAAWRAGVILNDLTGAALFDTAPGAALVDWPQGAPDPAPALADAG